MFDLSEVKIELQASFCNNWPKIEISINDQVLWDDYVVDTQLISVIYKKQSTNKLCIAYTNKRIGPNIWDTKIDDKGTIIEDQHCILKNIYFDQAKNSSIINKLEYTQRYGESLSGVNGWMTSPGHYQIEFPYDVYDWIIQSREDTKLASHKRQSSLSYFTSYLGDNNNNEIQEKMNKIYSMIDQLL